MKTSTAHHENSTTEKNQARIKKNLQRNGARKGAKPTVREVKRGDVSSGQNVRNEDDSQGGPQNSKKNLTRENKREPRKTTASSPKTEGRKKDCLRKSGKKRVHTQDGEKQGKKIVHNSCGHA